MLRKPFQLLPEWARKPARLARAVTRRILYFGKARWCPVCEKPSRIFRTFGAVPRKDAQCVRCNSLERHRLVWLYFARMTNLFDGGQKKMLHVAPELCFESRLRNRLGHDYVTADLMDPHAMVRMNITDIPYEDGYFDVIYCSHVLEHVQDDRRAMREFRRVLKPDGWAVLLVPITVDTTYEDPSITEPAERLKAFGQDDHVRRYGVDYIDRLRESGFTVKVSNASELFNEDDIVRLGLTRSSGDIFYCTKGQKPE